MAKRSIENSLPKRDPEILASLSVQVGDQVILRNIEGEEGTIATVEKVVKDRNNKPLTINVFFEKNNKKHIIQGLPGNKWRAVTS
jgi:hypothetical protein